MRGALQRALRGLRRRFAPDGQLRRAALQPACTTAERGALGEELVARALVREGHRVVARRLQTTVAELDLVARAPDGALVVVEVKCGVVARLGDVRYRPGLHLGRAQRERLVRAARALARARRPVRDARGSGRLSGDPTAWRVELAELVLAQDGLRLARTILGRGRLSDGTVSSSREAEA